MTYESTVYMLLCNVALNEIEYYTKQIGILKDKTQSAASTTKRQRLSDIEESHDGESFQYAIENTNDDSQDDSHEERDAIPLMNTKANNARIIEHTLTRTVKYETFEYGESIPTANNETSLKYSRDVPWYKQNKIRKGMGYSGSAYQGERNEKDTFKSGLEILSNSYK